MDIIKEQDGTKLTVALTGRLDTTTAPELEQSISDIDDITTLVFNFEKLEYVSSAGLRVLLSAQKRMNKQGSMEIFNVSSDILEVFDITGFSDILTIK